MMKNILFLLALATTAVVLMAHRCKKTDPPKWKKIAHLQVTGGKYNASAKAVDACQNLCGKMAHCKAIDWDKKGKKCYTFAKRVLRKNKNVDRYVEVNRNGKSTEWHKFQNLQAKGGKYFQNAKTVDDCKEACKKIAKCDSIDWNKKGKRCYTFSNGHLLQNTNFDRYIKVTCRRARRWKKIPHLQVTGGKYHASAKTVRACKHICRKRAHCKAIDWDTKGKKCYTFKKRVLRKNKNVDRYVEVNRTGKSVQWHKFPKLQARGGKYYKEAKTVDTCQKACKKIAKCDSIDWNKKGKKCYTFSNGHLLQNDDYVRYIKVTRCHGRRWKKIAHLQVTGGKYHASAKNVRGCRHICGKMAHCKAIDWDKKGKKCYTFLKRVLRKNKNVDRYVQVLRTSTSSKWHKFPNLQARGGKYYKEAKTVDDCQQACRKNAKCDSIDWNKKGKKCYTFTNGHLLQNDNFDRYIKGSCHRSK